MGALNKKVVEKRTDLADELMIQSDYNVVNYNSHTCEIFLSDQLYMIRYKFENCTRHEQVIV